MISLPPSLTNLHSRHVHYSPSIEHAWGWALQSHHALLYLHHSTECLRVAQQLLELISPHLWVMWQVALQQKVLTLHLPFEQIALPEKEKGKCALNRVHTNALLWQLTIWAAWGLLASRGWVRMIWNKPVNKCALGQTAIHTYVKCLCTDKQSNTLQYMAPGQMTWTKIPRII